ncbi:hypothetical protein H4R24_003486 [Coemansia sp. RSA 988]|nr:hypothetical protein H4R24_003486 [Coemansia sp. RSA 988]
MQAGEVANRIVTVGDPQRARTMAKHMDQILFEHSSHRGFLTITGIYRGLPLSIVAIGMGAPMMDFFVREARMVVSGPLTIIRFGSCGSICNAGIGDVIAATGAFAINRNFAYFDNTPPVGMSYDLSPVVNADPRLTSALTARLDAALGASHVYRGQIGNADSFYGSQGRPASDFYDANHDLIPRLHNVFPDAVALEMESHMLLHLARFSTGSDNAHPPSIRAACALMVYADRSGDVFISPETSKRLSQLSATAVFDALIDDMPSQDGLHPAAGSVWESALSPV